MAITLADFNKIWASTSPLTPYSFSESNYKQGWNFIGSTPPARQMWDFLQKNNDEKMQYLANNYLPLSGGTMTGSISCGGGQIINATTDNTWMRFDGATNDTKGGSLKLFGKDHAGAGRFSLTANNGTVSKELRGQPDGTLTWGGQPIPDRSYGVNLISTAGENTYTFSINTNGAVIFAKRGASCSCHMVDYWTSGSVKIFSTATDPITITKSANSNSVTITNAYSNTVAIKILNGGNL